MVVLATVDQNGVTEGSGSYTTRNMSTATPLNLSPRETPQSVSVMTRQRMNDQNMTSLDEAMGQTTGVNVVNQNGFQVKYESRVRDGQHQGRWRQHLHPKQRDELFSGVERIARYGDL
jgi:outer membrane receptor for ferric coprogen and ferric-rhodotorulic acid